MGQLLAWYSANNSLIIQTLSLLIGLLLCFFIFSLFFGSQRDQSEKGLGSDSSAGIQTLEKKINQIIEAQSKVILSTKTGISEESLQQIEQLQTEIFNLRQTLKEEVDAAEESSLRIDKKTGTGAGSLTESMKQIEDLKNRLSDYEVIAEDIAELQSLREENQKLQTQLQELGTKSTLVGELTDKDKALIQQFEKSKGS